MKNIILHVLCEGQTEDRFVKDVLKNYLSDFTVICKHQILLTSKQKNSYGGMLSFNQAKRDLELMMKQFQDNENEEHWFTTMFDYYRLPNDFPGYADEINDVYSKIEHIEDQFSKEIDNKRFIPYLQLHEFESLVFADLDYLLNEFNTSQDKRLNKSIDKLKELLKKKEDNPELINTIKAPSKYLIDALEPQHYNKPKNGSSIVSKIGVPTLRKRCKHFNDWIEKILGLAVR